MDPSRAVEHLKRRRVFRAVAAYGGLALLVITVAEPVMHGLHVPEWVLSLTVVLLAVGFPAVALLAWAFDVAADMGRRAGPRWTSLEKRRAALVAAAGLAVAAPGLVYFFGFRHRDGPAVESAPQPSVAVLPFADLSPGKDQEYFADGVAEEIIDALSHVAGLKVIARTSSFAFKGRSDDLKTIGEKLGVAHVVEGSLRKDGDEIRVSAKLIRIADGSHVWSEVYDRKLAGIFRAQDDIARNVVAALRGRLVAKVGGAPRSTPATSPAAYDEYLRGSQLYRTFTLDGWRQAVAAYRRAADIDPAFAPAWAAQAIPLVLAAKRAPTLASMQALHEQALGAVDHALALSPDLCEGLSSRGITRQMLRWDWEGARADLERAVRLCPGDADAWRRYAILLDNLRRHDEAVAAAEKAARLDPLGISVLKLGEVLMAAGRLDDAVATLQRAVELKPDSGAAAMVLGEALLLQGRASDALARFRRPPVAPEEAIPDVAMARYTLGEREEAVSLLRQLEPTATPGDLVGLATAWAWVGDRDRAFAVLDRALDARVSDLGEEFATYPLRRDLRSDPRWGRVLRKLNLPGG